MESASYAIGWLLYLVGALGLTIVVWRMTRNITLRRTRRSFRALVAVILFTPINIGSASTWLAPAYLIGAYDWVLGEVERAQLAALLLLVAYALVILVIMLESVMRRLLGMEYGK